jgi:hypothetical protein
MTKRRRATEAEVRKHYEDQDYEVRIVDDGHVEYRKDDGEWLEGRFLEEYWIDPEYGIYLK